MRRALARLNASTMMSSSIRNSLVGAQVGCTTNTSRARTFCWISTSTSPSEKRPTLALPVNSTVLNSTALRASWERGSAGCLAGEEGFEPSYVGIKIRCLNQLGDSPTRAPAYAGAPSNLQPDQCSSGCTDKLRHMRPTQRGGRSSALQVATGRSPVPALANTALPDPDMRL